MKILHEADVPLERRKDQPRDGRFEFRRLLEGEPGRPDNFFLQLSRTYGDFFSPRHKHNFDQFRFQIEGEFDFGRDGRMVPGTIAYFPEGTSYGPQSSSDDALVLVLQFGGASGNGYMSEAEMTHSIQELKKTGEFAKGVYTQIKPDGRRVNKDGYEATWENHSGRPLVYPPPRFQQPVFMNPENFEWVASPGETGAWRKSLGVFNERRTSAGFLKLEAGARMRVSGPSVLFVVSGTGRCGTEAWEPHASMHFAAGETAEIEGTTEAVILEMGLPDLSTFAEIRRPEAALAG